MKTQHTPGPWQIDCRENESPCIIREPAKPAGSRDEWLAVCQLFGPSPVREANARLIAAAPELLEELEHAASDIESLMRMLERHADISCKGGNLEFSLTKIKVALAKAKGGV